MTTANNHTRDTSQRRFNTHLSLFIAATLMAAGANAKPAVLDRLVPDGVFLQAGVAENNTQAYVLGAIWDWNWQKRYSFGTVTGYAEASLGRWITDVGDTRASAWATQLGITPVFRLQLSSLPQWFVEAGIGANVILPIYRSKDKRFSTEFNFGDHIAMGYWLDATHEHEVALRFQHFSNAGIDHPNPGENFVQLRYSYRF